MFFVLQGFSFCRSNKDSLNVLNLNIMILFYKLIWPLHTYLTSLYWASKGILGLFSFYSDNSLTHFILPCRWLKVRVKWGRHSFCDSFFVSWYIWNKFKKKKKCTKMFEVTLLHILKYFVIFLHNLILSTNYISWSVSFL